MKGKNEEKGIWCGFCNKKIVGLDEIKKADNGKIGWLDRRRMDWYRIVANLGGVKLHNRTHLFVMVKIHHHFVKQHKRELAVLLKKKNNRKLFTDLIKVKGKKEMEELGVVFDDFIEDT